MIRGAGKARRSWWLVALCLSIHSCLLAYSAYVHSPTLNEPAHLAAGVSHWKFSRFELFRVNPPLVRMVAAVPVLCAGVETDWSRFHEEPGARAEFLIGDDLIRANGERSYSLLMIARWGCIPFSWLGAIICFLWGRDMYGHAAGLLACLTWCFCPTILGHASLITPDAHATSLGLAAGYTFWRWLRRPTWCQAVLTGGVLGLAELAKTTLILFYPIWPILWVLYRWADRARITPATWLREAGMLALRMAVGLYVLNCGYGFEGSFNSLGSFHFTSRMFSGTRGDSGLPSMVASRDERLDNRFVGTVLQHLPVVVPQNYLLGIDSQQRDFENYGRPSYLRGRWQERGWWYYYFYACGIKVPLGVWGIALLSIVRRIGSAPPHASFRDEMILLTPAVVIFAVVSVKTGVNEHFRYALPCFPFAFVWISAVVQKSARPPQATSLTITASLVKSLRSWTPRMSHLIAMCTSWFILSSLWIYPHSLSYFNESIGGPNHGYRHLVNSNLDWGQDLRYLQWWLDDRENRQPSQPVCLAYFGFFDPKDVGFMETLPWPKETTRTIAKELPTAEDGARPTHPHDGLCAISVTLLAGYPWSPRIGVGRSGIIAHDSLAPIRDLKPIGTAGYSIHVYNRLEVIENLPSVCAEMEVLSGGNPR